MNTQDIQWMIQELEFLGFPAKTHAQEIGQNIRDERDKFCIEGKTKFFNYGNEDTLTYGIWFKHYERQQHYYPYAYRAVLNEQDRSRMFPIVQDAAFTLKDAFNLLQGRSVHKMVIDQRDRKLKPIWYQLDLSKTDVHGNYPLNQFLNSTFNLGNHLDRHGILEMKNPEQRINLILSLYQGNAEAVTMQALGQREPVYVSADPVRNTVKFCSTKGTALSTQLEKPSASRQLRDEFRNRKLKGKSL